MQIGCTESSAGDGGSGRIRVRNYRMIASGGDTSALLASLRDRNFDLYWLVTRRRNSCREFGCRRFEREGGVKGDKEWVVMAETSWDSKELFDWCNKRCIIFTCWKFHCLQLVENNSEKYLRHIIYIFRRICKYVFTESYVEIELSLINKSVKKARAETKSKCNPRIGVDHLTLKNCNYFYIFNLNSFSLWFCISTKVKIGQ